uniref:Uncharacterized protein n=1 Tax=Anguilla anguilla TaxID=7936 RepID=A0A0E9WKY1_ANGAN
MQISYTGKPKMVLSSYLQTRQGNAVVPKILWSGLPFGNRIFFPEKSHAKSVKVSLIC